MTHPVRRAAGAVLVAAALAALAACSNGVGNEAPARYVLASVDGSPPGAAAGSPATACIAGASLRLGAGDRFRLQFEHRPGCTTAAAPISDATGIYEREGDQMRFYVGPATADSAVEESILQGTVKGDTLSLRDTRSGASLRFVRSADGEAGRPRN